MTQLFEIVYAAVKCITSFTYLKNSIFTIKKYKNENKEKKTIKFFLFFCIKKFVKKMLASNKLILNFSNVFVLCCNS